MLRHSPKRPRHRSIDAVECLENIQEMEAVHMPDHVEGLFHSGEAAVTHRLVEDAFGKPRILNASDEEMIEADAACVTVERWHPRLLARLHGRKRAVDAK